MGLDKNKRPLLVPFLRTEDGAEIRSGTGAPTDGSSGTGAGDSEPGSFYIDVTSGAWYINSGTLAAPAWAPSGGGSEAAIEVYNESGATIEDGDLVYLSGYDETNAKPTIDLADADVQGAPAEFVIRSDIANLAAGLAHKTYRETGGIDLAAATEGDPLYLSTTAGDATLADPTDADPNALSQIVGFAAVIATDVTEYNLNAPLVQIGTNEIQDNAVELAKLAGLAAGTMIAGDGSGDPASVLVTGTNGLPLTGQTAAVPVFALLDPAAQVEGSMIFIKAELTDTNALALATGAGVEVIPTPGANKAIIVHSFHIVADAAAGAWVEPSAPDDLVLQYAGGTDISGAIESGVLVAADVSFSKYGVIDTEITPEANVGVNLFNTGTNWTGGNAANSLDLHIFYSIVETVAFT